MKKVILTALVVIVAVGGAIAGKHAPVKTQTESEYTYYQEGICDTPISCSDDGLGALCSEYYLSTVLYSAPGCNVTNQVAIPQGKLPF